ncbi:MAG TPA: hypothetical protein VKT80_16310 [Chloroflexota bacterium]|nr:hypothetical protein [Chloroflexota bacterium]
MGFRLMVEARSLSARLRSGSSHFQNVSPPIPYRVDAEQGSFVAGPAIAFFWTPARGLYVGAEMSIAIGPGRDGDRATSGSSIGVEPRASGWLGLGLVTGARARLGRLWVGGELVLGESDSGVNTTVIYNGEPYRRHQSADVWNWRAEPRGTLAIPFAVGNLEAYAGVDWVDSSLPGSVVAGLGYSWLDF